MSLSTDARQRQLLALTSVGEQPLVLWLLLYATTGVTPPLGDVQGGTVLRVFGEGFANRSDSECVFGGGALREPATWVSPTEVRCVAPPLNVSSGQCQGDQLEVAVVPGAETRNAVTLLRTPTPTILGVEPGRGYYGLPQWVTLTGYGFVASEQLACLFYAGEARVRVTVPDVAYVSPSEVACLQPVLDAPFLRPSYVELSVDGQVLSNPQTPQSRPQMS